MALWKHECIRVISDRFTNQPDKDWFEKTMKRVIGEELGEDMQAMTENMPYLVDFLRFIPQLCLWISTSLVELPLPFLFY